MGGSLFRSVRNLSWAVLVGLLVAACGGDEASDPTDTTVSTPATTLASTTTTGPGFVAPELPGTSWNITLYQLPNGSMTNLWPGTEITISFDSDGSVSGFSGCNDYGASFEVEGPYDEFVPGTRDPNDGQVIRIGALKVTERGCESPGGVMEQETEYLDALQGAARWLLGSENQLLLRTADGFFLVEGEPVA